MGRIDTCMNFTYPIISTDEAIGGGCVGIVSDETNNQIIVAYEVSQDYFEGSFPPTSTPWSPIGTLTSQNIALVAYSYNRKYQLNR